jgi:hypothetical protein
MQFTEDITGCAIKRCNPMIVSKLNESIMGMMFMEPNVQSNLVEIVTADKSCGIAHILLIYELLKNSSLSKSKQELIANSFIELNKLLKRHYKKFLFNRQNDKNMRQFIIDECIIDSIISLPIKTFFTTPKKTYLLCITKKVNRSR